MTGPATVHLGGQLRDAADPSHNVQPDQCAVCDSTNPDLLHRINLDHADLARIGLRGAAPILCLPHYQTALESLGQPQPTGNGVTCIRCHAVGVVIAVWPLRHTDARQPIWRACRPCLAAAIAQLTNRPQETTTR